MVIEDIIAKGEDIHSEFKTSFNIEAIESLVAFANTNGGAVYIGISDSGEVKGVDLSKETIVNMLLCASRLYFFFRLYSENISGFY